MHFKKFCRFYSSNLFDFLKNFHNLDVIMHLIYNSSFSVFWTFYF